MKLKVLTLGLALALQNASVLANDGFNTIELTQETLQQLPTCLDYKIHGISFRLVLKPIPHIIKTLNVSHNAPELITQTHIDLDNMPWNEVNAVFGVPYKAASGTIFKGSMSVVSPEAAKAPISSGQYHYGEFGQHQAGQQYETSIFGNPLAFLMNGIKWSGYKIPHIPDSGKIGDGDNFFEKWIEGSFSAIPRAVIFKTGLDDAVKMISSQTSIETFARHPDPNWLKYTQPPKTKGTYHGMETNRTTWTC